MTASLALYHLPTCHYCLRVRFEIKRLKLSVPLRSLFSDPEYSASLMAELGRTTVPVLRIENAEGHVTWMPESADIIEYLRKAKARL